MDELELVKQVEFKLLLINDSTKFTQALDLYLCPLLLKLGSPSHPVRAKVLQVLQHLNSRLGSNVKLPLDKLLTQLQDPTLSPLIKTVDLTYIKKAIDKGSASLLLQLSKTISSQEIDVARGQFSLFLTALTTSDSTELLPQSSDLDYLIYRTAQLFLVDLKFISKGRCPGLSSRHYAFLTHELTEAKLSAAKPKIVQWWTYLANNGIDHAKLFAPLVIAQEDRLQEAWSPAKLLFKNIGLQSFDLTPEIAKQLAALTKPSQIYTPAKIDLIVRIFDILAAADWAALCNIDLYALVHPALQSTDQRWVISALKLLRTAIKKSQPLLRSREYCKDVHQYIITLGISYGTTNENVRSSAYETLGMLAAVTPIEDLSIINFLLHSLDRDAVTMVPSIQSALSELVNKPIPGHLKDELLRSLFKSFLNTDRDGTRYSVVRYMIRAFPFENVKARLVCLLASSPNTTSRSDIKEEGNRGSDPYLFATEHGVDAETIEFPPSTDMCDVLEENISNIPNAGPVVAFIFQCIGLEAGLHIPRDQKWNKTFWVSAEHDVSSHAKLRHYLDDKDLDSLLSFCVPGLLIDDPKSTLVWSLLMKLASHDTLAGQTKHVPLLLQAMKSKKSISFNVVAESIARLYPGDDLQAFCQQLLQDLTPNTALLLAYFVKVRSVDADPLDYCIENKLWDAVYQLALARVIKPTDKLVMALNLSTEKSCLAYGALALSDPENSSVYLDRLLGVNTNSKNIDYLLANGEAISIAASGWDSTLLHHEEKPHTSQVNLILHALKKIFKDAKASPVNRRYSSVRLLCLCQYNRDHIEPYIQDIQSCLLTFLSDADEISQECASRGLGALFEYSDKATQQSLVQRLVLLFTNDGAIKPLGGGRISDDTELFQPGVLNTGDGSVSTYKDVLNLANEVGDSSLVYKFMSLASSSQLWSTRRGAAFGLENIMARAEISGDLVSATSKVGKNLIPKLFRYQFDSNQNVRDTMKSIWDALVKDRQKTISDHFETIMNELLTGTTKYEWRVREASTAGLTNLVETMDWKLLSSYSQELWSIAFRMVDDIKESVRTAGFQFSKALVSVLTRRLDSQARGNGDLLGMLIPFLFSTKGIHNDSEEVRAFALSALLKIAASTSPDVKSFRVDMVEQFILLLSDLEPQAMNYIALNSNNFGVDASMVDERRLQEVKSSPILETVEKIIDGSDNAQMLEILRRWPNVIKRAVGLPSEIGASRIVVSICMRFPAGANVVPVLNACFRQLKSRNAAVSQSYTVATAYLCRLAPLTNIKRYAYDVTAIYFDPESNEAARLVTGQCMNALSKHASDKFLSIASLTLAFVAIGKEDGTKDVAEEFLKVWDSNTGGSESLKLYSRDIISLALPQIQSTSWNLRSACAKAIGKAASFLVQADSELVEQLLGALQGRTWAGKEHIYRALAQATKGLDDAGLREKAVERSINELQRKNGDFVVAILPSAAVFLACNGNQDLYKLFYQKCNAALTGILETDNEISEDSKIEIFNGAVEAYDDRYNVQEAMDQLIRTMLVGWKLKQAACRGVAALGKRKYFSQDVWAQLCKLCGQDYGHEIVRIAWVEAAVALKSFGIENDVARILQNDPSSAVIAEAHNAGFI